VFLAAPDAPVRWRKSTGSESSRSSLSKSRISCWIVCGIRIRRDLPARAGRKAVLRQPGLPPSGLRPVGALRGGACLDNL